MTIEVIRDHNELPARPSPAHLRDNSPWQWEYYLRSQTDPHVVIGGHSGDCYRRSDGAEWTHPVYQVEPDASGHVSCLPSYTTVRQSEVTIATPSRRARR